MNAQLMHILNLPGSIFWIRRKLGIGGYCNTVVIVAIPLIYSPETFVSVYFIPDRSPLSNNTI